MSIKPLGQQMNGTCFAMAIKMNVHPSLQKDPQLLPPMIQNEEVKLDWQNFCSLSDIPKNETN